MFSSIDEAWKTPMNAAASPFSHVGNPHRIIENYGGAKPCCDDLIKKVMQCPGCMEKIASIMNKKRINPILGVVRGIYQRYVENLSPMTRDKIGLIAIVFVLFLLVYIVLER